jgi:BirA family transcriptional regulator, biotin operon repressor / biotin---[acetyl-CoA-carboxylase] ligase
VLCEKENHVPQARATFQLQSLARELKPFKLHWFPTLRSTNSHAARMRREGRLLAPSVVLTGNQTAGRGRGSNVWHSAQGVLTATFILPAHETLPPQHVPLIAGLAVREAVAGFGIEAVKIKWPNDLWIDDRKLAGMLCERIDRVDLIGVGLNVSVDSLPGALRTHPTSLAEHLPAPPGTTEVLIAIAHSLHAHLADARSSLARVLDRIRAQDALAGREVRVVEADRVIGGICRGIDSSGRLKVWTGTAEMSLFNGSVSLVSAKPK